MTGSRAYTIGILIAWRTIVSHILTAISALGAAARSCRDIGFVRLAPDAVVEVRERGTETSAPPLAAAVAVPLLWLVVAIAVGAWRTATRDA